ncbi:hypothetical protein ACFLTD_04470, partial [Elusimicrobiota bacterium]
FFYHVPSIVIRYDNIGQKTISGELGIRIKSLGSARGEEPYTLAFVIYSELKKYFNDYTDYIVKKYGVESFNDWLDIWDVEIEAYDYSVLSLFHIEQARYALSFKERKNLKLEDSAFWEESEARIVDGKEKSVSRIREPVRNWVKPIFIDMNNSEAIKLIGKKPADVIFHLNTSPYIFEGFRNYSKKRKRRQEIRETFKKDYNGFFAYDRFFYFGKTEIVPVTGETAAKPEDKKALSIAGIKTAVFLGNITGLISIMASYFTLFELRFEDPLLNTARFALALAIGSLWFKGMPVLLHFYRVRKFVDEAYDSLKEGAEDQDIIELKAQFNLIPEFKNTPDIEEGSKKILYIDENGVLKTDKAVLLKMPADIQYAMYMHELVHYHGRGEIWAYYLQGKYWFQFFGKHEIRENLFSRSDIIVPNDYTRDMIEEYRERIFNKFFLHKDDEPSYYIRLLNTARYLIPEEPAAPLRKDLWQYERLVFFDRMVKRFSDIRRPDIIDSIKGMVEDDYEAFTAFKKLVNENLVLIRYLHDNDPGFQKLYEYNIDLYTYLTGRFALLGFDYSSPAQVIEELDGLKDNISIYIEDLEKPEEYLSSRGRYLSKIDDAIYNSSKHTDPINHDKWKENPPKNIDRLIEYMSDLLHPELRAIRQLIIDDFDMFLEYKKIIDEFLPLQNYAMRHLYHPVVIEVIRDMDVEIGSAHRGAPDPDNPQIHLNILRRSLDAARMISQKIEAEKEGYGKGIEDAIASIPEKPTDEQFEKTEFWGRLENYPENYEDLLKFFTGMGHGRKLNDLLSLFTDDYRAFYGFVTALNNTLPVIKPAVDTDASLITTNKERRSHEKFVQYKFYIPHFTDIEQYKEHSDNLVKEIDEFTESVSKKVKISEFVEDLINNQTVFIQGYSEDHFNIGLVLRYIHNDWDDLADENDKHSNIINYLPEAMQLSANKRSLEMLLADIENLDAMDKVPETVAFMYPNIVTYLYRGVEVLRDERLKDGGILIFTETLKQGTPIEKSRIKDEYIYQDDIRKIVHETAHVVTDALFEDKEDLNRLMGLLREHPGFKNNKIALEELIKGLWETESLENEVLTVLISLFFPVDDKVQELSAGGLDKKVAEFFGFPAARESEKSDLQKELEGSGFKYMADKVRQLVTEDVMYPYRAPEEAEKQPAPAKEIKGAIGKGMSVELGKFRPIDKVIDQKPLIQNKIMEVGDKLIDSINTELSALDREHTEFSNYILTLLAKYFARSSIDDKAIEYFNELTDPANEKIRSYLLKLPKEQRKNLYILIYKALPVHKLLKEYYEQDRFYTFDPLIEADDDYLLAYLTDDKIVIGRDFLTDAGFTDFLDEILFHEGYSEFFPEVYPDGRRNYRAHRKAIKTVQRLIFGQENPLAGLIREFIKEKLAERIHKEIPVYKRLPQLVNSMRFIPQEKIEQDYWLFVKDDLKEIPANYRNAYRAIIKGIIRNRSHVTVSCPESVRVPDFEKKLEWISNHLKNLMNSSTIKNMDEIVAMLYNFRNVPGLGGMLLNNLGYRKRNYLTKKYLSGITGMAGELIAALHLESERNYTILAFSLAYVRDGEKVSLYDESRKLEGEIDIMASKSGNLFAVEVKNLSRPIHHKRIMEKYERYDSVLSSVEYYDRPHNEWIKFIPQLDELHFNQ